MAEEAENSQLLIDRWAKLEQVAEAARRVAENPSDENLALLRRVLQGLEDAH